MEKNCEIMYNGEKMTVVVKDSIPYEERTKMAQSIAYAVVTNDGEYRPWLYTVLYYLNFITRYTDFVLPEEWHDNDVVSFFRADGELGLKLLSAANSIEQEEIRCWADELISYRKECYKKSDIDKLGLYLKQGLLYLKDKVSSDPEFIQEIKDIFMSFGGEN